MSGTVTRIRALSPVEQIEPPAVRRRLVPRPHVVDTPMDDLRVRMRALMEACPVAEEDVETVVVARQWTIEVRAFMQRLMSELEGVDRVLNEHNIPAGHLSPAQRVELLVERMSPHRTRLRTPVETAPVEPPSDLDDDEVIAALIDGDEP